MHQRLSGNSQLTRVHFTHVYSTLIVLKAERFTEAKQENSDYTKNYLQLQWNNRETKLLSLQKSSNYNNLYFFLTITRKREEKQICYITKRSSILNFKILSWFNTGIKNLQIFGRIERKVGCGVDPRHAFATLQLITYAHQHWYPRPLHGPCSSWRGTVWRKRNSSFSSHLHSYVAHFHLSVSKNGRCMYRQFFSHFKQKHLTYTESKELLDMH